MRTEIGKERGKNTPLAKSASFATPTKSAKNGKERDFASFATVLCRPAIYGKERPSPSKRGAGSLPFAKEVHDVC